MGLYEKLAGLIPFQINKKTPDPTIPVSDEGTNLFENELSNVPLTLLIDYLRRDTKYQYVSYTMMGYSAGAGFNNTANTNIPSGRKCLDMINDFAEEWDLDTINQSLALDGWSAGNGFLNVVPDAEKLAGIYHIGMGSVTNIFRSADGEIQGYEQKNQNGVKNTVPANEIAHFKLWPINESVWGEGLGQILARKGRGYLTSTGKQVQRQSYFQMNEMYTDVNGKIFYSMQPRNIIGPDNNTDQFDEKTMQQINSSMTKTDPLQNMTTPKKISLQTVALQSRSGYDTITNRYDKEFSISTKTPLIELASSMDFSYASSEVALNTMLPLLNSFQRSQKRFVEKNIYEPLILQAHKDPKIVNVRLNWGAAKKLTVEDIAIIQSILNQPDLFDKHSPKDIIDLLIEAGVPLPRTETLAGEVSNKLQFMRNIEAVADNNSKIKDLIILEREKMKSHHNASYIKQKENKQ